MIIYTIADKFISLIPNHIYSYYKRVICLYPEPPSYFFFKDFYFDGMYDIKSMHVK